MRIDASERFAFSFIYGNTQFRTKTLFTFRTKKVDSSLLVRLHWSIKVGSIQNSSCTFNVPMFTHWSGTAVIFHLEGSARPPISVFPLNIILVTQLFPPLPRMFQSLRLLPYLNLLFVQASDISNSLPRSENVRDVCLDCFDLICHLQTPASRARACCDCNPIRAFETFNISKEPIGKTSRFWMFWCK